MERTSPALNADTMDEVGTQRHRIDDFRAETLNLGELATVLGVHRDTLRRWRAQGALPAALPLAGTPRWSRAVVQEWLQQTQPVARTNRGRRSAA